MVLLLLLLEILVLLMLISAFGHFVYCLISDITHHKKDRIECAEMQAYVLPYQEFNITEEL